MARSLRFGRVGSAFAVVALVLSSLVAPASPVVAKTRKDAPASQIPQLERSEVMKGVPSVPATPVFPKASAQRGTPSIELNVDGPDDGQLSLFTFGTDIVVKIAFGNRFTIPASQAPFTLKQIAAVFASGADGGFEAGETAGITIMGDPAGTGNIANSVVLFNGTVVLPETNIFLGVDLPDPGITIKQGDIYVIVSDLADDGEDTPVPVLLEENGGSTDLRSFLLLNRDVPADPTAVGAYIPISSTTIVGNVRVRGFGDPADGGALITGNGQPVNTELDPPQNLTALGSSQVTLGYEAAPIPAVNETEPNNGPSTAQAVPFNQIVNATVKTSDPGTDVGGGVFEDWFAFTLTEASPVTVDVVDDGGVDIDIFLYLQSDTSAAIASSAGDCGAHELIDGVELAAGTYVVGIDAFPNAGCEATSNTPYQILIVGPGGVRLTAYNIFSGSSENFEANAASFIGAVGAGTTGIVIQESALGAYYRVSAVYGGEQSAPTDAATGSPCEGGPTVGGPIKVKRNGPGTIVLNGVSGPTAGAVLTINGVGFTKAVKIKKQGTKLQQKGPLANGQTVAQACPGECTLVIMVTGGGCSTVTLPAP